MYPLPIMHKGGGDATKITKIIFTDFVIRGMSSRHPRTGVLNHRLKPEIDGNKRQRCSCVCHEDGCVVLCIVCV